jgi:hypothetical protein
MYSDILHTASTTMPSDAAKFSSALISLVVSATLIWSLFVFENKKSLREFITDKKDPEEQDQDQDQDHDQDQDQDQDHDHDQDQDQDHDQDQEQDQEVEEVETEEIPMGEPLRRMCDFGCCPYGVSLPSYYNRFTTSALKDRKEECVKQRDFTGEEYSRAKDAYYFAKENFAAVTQAYNHVINSTEKINELYEMRVMDEQLDGHTKPEMYSMLAAVHQWKAFMYAPDGLYPYQKELWEKVLMKRIYTE